MNIKNKQGFTLIELLVGVLISVMIFMTAGSVIALLFRTDIRTKNTELLEQTKSDLQGELSSKIRWAQAISFTKDPDTLTVDGIVYSLSNGRILKDGDPLTSQNVTIKQLDIADYSRDADIASLEILIEMENSTTTTARDTLKLVVSQRKTVFEEK